MGKTRIFAFWEPKTAVPGYIRACMRTWNLVPDSETVLLDFDSIGEWLPQEELDAVTCRGLSLPKQADCYRALLLNRYGGIWLDTDTVVTPEIAQSGVLGTGEEDVVAFGLRPEDRQLEHVHVFGCFFNVRRPHVPFTEAWASVLPERMATFRRFRRNPLLRLLRRGEWRKCRSYDYCLNSIVNPLALSLDERQLSLLDEKAFGVHPEIMAEGHPARRSDAYREYYFRPGDPTPALEASKGLLLLHNSWSPESFRNMDESEFLRTDVRLAGILKALLGKLG